MQQSYGSTVAAPYTTYMYAQPPVQNSALYGASAPVIPQQVSRTQSSRYDNAFPPPPQGPYMAQMSGPPVIPPDPRQPVPRPRRYTENKPLKSALKKPAPSGLSVPGPNPNGNLHRSRTVPAGADPEAFRGREMRPTASNVSRAHSLSGSARATSVSRVRSRSRSRATFTPAHLILSLHGTCRLTLSSVIYQETVDNIRERVLTMWPDGVLFQTYRDESNEFVVQFCGNPWTAKNGLGSIAKKMILELFAVLARQGYSCASAIDTGRAISSPRLVFTRGQADPAAEFAMMIFSNNRRTVKLLNHAPQFCDSLTETLRDAFPRRLHRSSWNDSDVFVIEMHRQDFDSISDLMIAIILEHASNEGLKLEGAIPLTPSGFWSFLHSRKELWIFRRFRL